MENRELQASVDGQQLEIDEIKQQPAPQLPAVITIDERIKLEVAKYDGFKGQIEEVRAKMGEIKIDGVNDKQGEKRVESIWRGFRNIRLAVEKKREELKSDALALGKGIDSGAKDINKLLGTDEEDAKKELDRIKAERLFNDQEKERQDQAKLQGRVSDLLSNGMAFNGSYYAIGESISMDVVTLKEMPDAAFQDLILKVKAENQKAVDAKALADKAQQDKDAEFEKLKAQRVKLRTKLVKSLGFKWNDDTGRYDLQIGEEILIINDSEIEGLNDELFEGLYDATEKTIITMRYEQAEAVRLKARKDTRLAQLNEMGFLPDFLETCFILQYPHNIGRILVEAFHVESFTEEEWSERIAEIAKQDTENQAFCKTEDERLLKEADDKKATEKLLRERSEELIAKGFLRYQDGTGFARPFKYSLLIKPIKILTATVSSATPEQWEYVCGVHAAMIARGEAALAAEDKRLADEAETERVAGLSDADRVKEFAERLRVLVGEFPALTSTRMKARVKQHIMSLTHMPQILVEIADVK